MDRERANTTETVIQLGSTQDPKNSSSSSIDRASSNTTSNTASSSITTYSGVAQQLKSSLSHLKDHRKYYRYYPDYNVVNRRYLPSSNFNLMLLDAFRPFYAPSTIWPIEQVATVKTAESVELSSSSSSSDEFPENKKIPTVVLHSGSNTEASDTDDDSIRINESDE